MPPPPSSLPHPASARAGLSRWLVRLASHRGLSLALAGAVVMTDHLIHWQTFGFLPRALVDEPCHLATAFIGLGALSRWRGAPGPRFTWAMLSASVLIDADHLPLEFGSAAWTAGTPRPYTHALWVVAVLAVAAVASRRPAASGRTGPTPAAEIFAGAAWGVGAHFLRDVATAPIALWWPVSSVGVQVPYAWYLLALLALVAVPFPRRVAGRPDGGGTGSRDQAAVDGAPAGRPSVTTAGNPAGSPTGTGRAGSGRRPTADRGRSWPGASTGR